MKQDAELFKGKKEILEARARGQGSQAEELSPFIWNSSIQGDEMCQEVLK